MDTKELQQIFTYHVPSEEQIKKYIKLRLGGLTLAMLINDLCPESREKSMALSHLQEAIMLANASIAIHNG